MAKRKKRARSRRGRPSSLATLPTSALHEELERREEAAAELSAERDELLEHVQDLDAQIQELGGASSTSRRKKTTRRGPGRKRTVRKKKTTRKATNGRRKKTTSKKTVSRGGGRSGKSLADYLQQVLRSKTLSVAEATTAVKKAGYGSKSPNLRTMVNQQLLANPKRFKKVARGQYTAK